ncbi:C40 family peptidase [Azospirillum sp. sgz301742]
MSGPLDPRRHPHRPDLAAAHLKGRVDAARFVEGVPHRVRTGVVGMRGEPDAKARHTSQLLFGETFAVYDTQDGWSWGQCGTDGYVGWVRGQSLATDVHVPTHVVTAVRSFLFPEPDLKTPPRDSIPLGAQVTVLRTVNGYCELAGGGWLYGKHLSPPDALEPDPVATAERLLGVPYLWGGRTPLGIDCSGLAQLALLRAGIPCPRDSDMQRDEVGTRISEDGAGVAFRRGDLVFFPGHVGLMLDAAQLLHATAYTMTVTVEPVADVAARAGGITAVRRL